MSAIPLNIKLLTDGCRNGNEEIKIIIFAIYMQNLKR